MRFYQPTAGRGGCPSRQTAWGGGVEPIESGDLKLGIRQVSQVMLGEPSLADLLEHGFVKPSSTETIQAATALLSPKTTYSIEYF